MFRHRQSFIVLALVLVVAVIGGGLLHALIPHTHGALDDHSGKGAETIVWQMVHASIRHDDKKILFAQVEPLILILLSIIAIRTLNRTGSILYTRDFSDPRVHDARLSALRRGVFRYRVFG